MKEIQMMNAIYRSIECDRDFLTELENIRKGNLSVRQCKFYQLIKQAKIDVTPEEVAIYIKRIL